MTLNSQWSAADRNAAQTARAALYNGATINLYDGAQPADTTVAVTTQNKLAALSLGTPAFGAPVNGVLTATAIPTTPALLTGQASWCRIVAADGVTVLADGSVGTVAGQFNVVLSTTAIQQGADVTVSSLTITSPPAGS